MVENSNHQNAPRDEQFLRLLMRNQEKIYAFILALVHNCNDAEDIMQDATTVMWRKYETFDSETSFTAWGIAIARLLVLKFFEKNRYSKLSFSPDLEKKLDPRNYELIKMRYLEKKPTKLIADERGIAPHTMYRMMGKIHELNPYPLSRQKMGFFKVDSSPVNAAVGTEGARRATGVPTATPYTSAGLR